jgi:tRNA pseudouridine38-40 synthase
VSDQFSRIGKDGDLRIVSAEEKPMGFHARFDSKGKKYRYMIHCGTGMPVFLSDYRYHVRDRLDVDAMREAAAQIVGTHDFACFQAAGGTPRETTVRTIYSLEITEIPAMDPAAYSIASPAVGPTAGPDAEPGSQPQCSWIAEPGGQPQCNGAGVDIAIDVAGDGFLYNMVRIITGTLVEVGAGKLPVDRISGIIDGCDRRKAGHTAPPQGLYLVEVYY